ncbi:hypothetical protein Zmor_021905 [Zophobas morio]|uniref:Uncharacterized protein n=1 Tax=Zophobas morio TaxID=2755281 RepID=A0AA38I9Y8_9CUCU|nr:hypothetical protein Zmor_021905 [Zophobas morio]
MWRGSEITEDEIGRQIERLKRGKAPGGDGILNEEWMFEAEGVKERIWEDKRTVGFEDKFSERGDCKILHECWKEIRKEGGKHVWNERDK